MTYLAVYQQQFVARGQLEQVITEVKSLNLSFEPTVIKEEGCARVEVDWHGSVEEVLSRLPQANSASAPRRGRPKLGVVPKEVTLLPRHWEWLSSQRGGASAALRRLVEVAQRDASVEDTISLKQQQLDKFMVLFLGDNPGFEEASRALYRNSRIGFCSATESWPQQIRKFTLAKFDEIGALHRGEVSP